MKKIIYLFSALLIFTVTGCDNWLSDPKPLGEVEASDLYTSEEGFRNVLVGAYINMATDKLYGSKMTMYLPELLTQHWELSSSTSTEVYVKRFDFEHDGVKSVISNAWQGYYNCIVNLNSLLSEIDAKKHLFSDESYRLIKGEALGLRAFLHFDVLRFWGPVPAGADLSKPAVPYLDKVTKDLKDLVSVSYKEVLDGILRDLKLAEELLADDPIKRFSRSTLTSPNDGNIATVGDEFWFYRQNRFNLYAVKATMARYYLWINNKPEALKYAGEVISATVNDESKVFTLGDNAYLADSRYSNDLLLSTEHIFAIHNYKLRAITEPLFKGGGTFSQLPAQMSQVYENYSDDLRWRADRYWQNVTYSGGMTYMFKKYLSADYAIAAEYVPVIRISEMYLIAMECSSPAQAKEYFAPYRLARNLNSAWINLLVDEQSVIDRVEREYRKDFFGEGQMFYYYKRHKTENLSWPQNIKMNLDNYVIPKPEKQSMFE